MNKISTLALIAALGLAIPAYAQAPAAEHPDTTREIHKEKMEKREEHKEHRKEEMKKHHERKEHHKKEEKKHEEHHDEKTGQ